MPNAKAILICASFDLWGPGVSELEERRVFTFCFVFSPYWIESFQWGAESNMTKAPQSWNALFFHSLSPNPNPVIMWRAYTAIFAACSFTLKNLSSSSKSLLSTGGLHSKGPSSKQETQETEKNTSPPLQLYCPALGQPALVAQQVPGSEVNRDTCLSLHWTNARVLNKFFEIKDAWQYYGSRTLLRCLHSLPVKIIRIFASKSQQHFTWEKKQEK